MNEILSNIRKNNIKHALLSLVPTCILSFMLYGLCYCIINDEIELNFLYFIFLVVIVIFGYYSYKSLIESLILIIDPLKDNLFKKYGSPEKISKILQEIEKTKLYEDKHLVISKNYISDKTDYSKIVACKDVLGVHKLVHKTNYIIDYYQIVITDKYNIEFTYQYGKKEEDKVNKLLMIIAEICPNAALGYTDAERKHIIDNKIDLPDEIKEDIDTDGDIDKSEKENNSIEKDDSPNNVDKKDSDLRKLKKLLDDNIITEDEFIKEKQKVLK